MAFKTIVVVSLISIIIYTNYDFETIDDRFISYGEILFEHNCTNCHSRNLKNYMIGPALGNITKHRSQQYLRKVTKNFSQEINIKNDLAICVFKQWGSIMSNFEHLSTSEIDSIYQFVEKESIRQNIGVNDVIYVQSCEEIDYNYIFYDKEGNRIEQFPFDTIKIQKQIDKNKFENLFFKETLYNYNDSLNSDFIDLTYFKIQSELPKNNLIKGYLLYEDIGFTQPLDYFRESFYYVFPNLKDSYKIYNNENFKIILIEESNHERIYFGSKELTRSELNNLHIIELKEESKIKILELINNKKVDNN